MDIRLIACDYEKCSIEELINIQQECFVTIKASLYELSNHIDQNVNQIFFLLCIASCIQDGFVDEKEFQLVKNYLGPNVSYDDYNTYAKKLVKLNNLNQMIVNFIAIVNQFSKESVEEYIKFILCFMAAKGKVEDVDYSFIEEINKSLGEDKVC